jgi:hypothetical protein
VRGSSTEAVVVSELLPLRPLPVGGSHQLAAVAISLHLSYLNYYDLVDTDRKSLLEWIVI